MSSGSNMERSLPSCIPFICLSFLRRKTCRGQKAEPHTTKPPFTPSTCPVTKPACSDARKATAAAMSCRVPRRHSGVSSHRAALSCAEKACHHLCVHCTGRNAVHRHAAGALFFGKRLCHANQRRLSRRIRHLARGAHLPPHGGDIDNAPPLWRIICGSAALQHKNAPRTCTAIISSHSAAVTSVNNFLLRYARVVHKDIRLAQRSAHILEQAATLASLCTSSSNGAAVPPLPGYFAAPAAHLPAGYASHGHTAPCRRQCQGRGAPNAAGSACYNCGFFPFWFLPRLRCSRRRSKTGPAGRRILAPTGRFPPSAHG